MSEGVAAGGGEAARPGTLPAVAAPMRRGLVALGDSITNGRGEPWLGVPALSWAQWVAEALELPFTKLARDGARADDVLRDLAPRLAGPYDVATIYVGVNDARSLDWDAEAYERSLIALASAAREATAGRLLLLTPPADLGRPTCAPKALEAATIVRRVAREQGALVVALDDLAGRRFVLPDAVHPTALGQVEIAARAINVLAADGLPPRHDVWQLADRQRSLRAARAADRRWLALLAQDLWRRAVERLAR